MEMNLAVVDKVVTGLLVKTGAAGENAPTKEKKENAINAMESLIVKIWCKVFLKSRMQR